MQKKLAKMKKKFLKILFEKIILKSKDFFFLLLFIF